MRTFLLFSCVVACSATVVEVDDDGSADGAAGHGEGASTSTGGGDSGGAGSSGGSSKVFPAAAPDLTEGYFEVREILSVADDPVGDAAIVGLADGRFVMAWTPEVDTPPPNPPIRLRWVVGADSSWSEPAEVPGIGDLELAGRLELFEDAGRLVLFIEQESDEPDLVATGSLDGLTLVTQIADRYDTAQHPDGRIFVATVNRDTPYRVRLLRLDGDSFVDAGISFDAITDACAPSDVQIAFRSDGSLVTAVRCDDGNWLLASLEDGAWSEGGRWPTESVLLGPHDGTSPSVWAFLRTPDYRYEFGPDAPSFETPRPGWSPDEAWNSGVIDPWGRAFVLEGVEDHEEDVHLTSDGIAWTGLQVVNPIDDVGPAGLVAAFQRTTGYPIFGNGNTVLVYRRTPD